MDEATWAALAVTLTVAGVIWTWLAFKRRGAANGLRALGFTLLPAAAWLTGTLQMVTEIGRSVTRWATSLVFSPFTWAGISLAGLAVLLIVISGILRDRQLGRGQAATSGKASRKVSGSDPAPRQVGTGSGRSSAPIDDDLADIEALLKKRGIE